MWTGLIWTFLLCILWLDGSLTVRFSTLIGNHYLYTHTHTRTHALPASPRARRGLLYVGLRQAFRAKRQREPSLVFLSFLVTIVYEFGGETGLCCPGPCSCTWEGGRYRYTKLPKKQRYKDTKMLRSWSVVMSMCCTDDGNGGVSGTPCVFNATQRSVSASEHSSRSRARRLPRRLALGRVS